VKTKNEIYLEFNQTSNQAVIKYGDKELRCVSKIDIAPIVCDHRIQASLTFDAVSFVIRLSELTEIDLSTVTDLVKTLEEAEIFKGILEKCIKDVLLD
jgi:hypothetical protein